MGQTAALIVAAGKGTRAGGGTPKQWRPLSGTRVADWTLKAFRTSAQVDVIVLVLSPTDQRAWDEFQNDPDLILAKGGPDRSTSVKNGLAALDGLNVSKVLIHDVARPCVSQALIASVCDALDTHLAVAPGLPSPMRYGLGPTPHVTGTQDRSQLFAAQTPQGFRYNDICAAHDAHPGGAADDVEVAAPPVLPLPSFPAIATI